MHTYNQIALGLLPLTLFCVISAVASRKHRARNIALAAILFVSAGSVAASSFFWTKAGVPDSKYDELSLIYAVAEEDSPELAKLLLQDIRGGYKTEYALCAARLAAKSGDYQAAKALYLKSVPLFPEAKEEYDAVLAVSAAEDAYYGIADISETAAFYPAKEELSSGVSKRLLKVFRSAVVETDDDIYGKAAGYIVYADTAHQAYLYGGFDESDARKHLHKMNNFLEENPELLEITQVRLARLKLQIITGEYKDIAANVNEDSDYNELLIVSELYLNKYVGKQDFPEGFSQEITEKYKAVYDRLDDIYYEEYQDKPREERNAAKAQLKSLKLTIKNPELSKIEAGLINYAGERYAVDASKAYLQASKIEHSLGNTPKVAEYLDRSIDTAGDCEDSSYTAPMYELAGIITDKDDPERLESAAVYVDRVLDNNMTVKLAENGDAWIDDNENDAAESGEDALTGDFASRMQTYISQKRMAIKIVNVDTAGFDQNSRISATVNIGNNSDYPTVDALKAVMEVSDCGVTIDDFSLEKVEYSGANILLCVDVSGSMDGYKIESLINAIKQFSADKAAIENIALITFNEGIMDYYSFGTSVDGLDAAADAIHAEGGTNMYGALIEAISKFTKGDGIINSIILMSDGLDNSPAGMEEIEENIGKACQASGITVYSIGFGNDADSTYLNSFAAATGGAYLYANEPDSNTQVNQLSEFFDGLRAQILNQYRITFTAKDTLSYTRELKVGIGRGLDSDRVTYYLGNGADSMTEPEMKENSPVYSNQKAVYGFEPRMLFKNGRTLNTILKGEGFTADDNISIYLKEHTTGFEILLTAGFEDANTVKITIPAGIGVGVYDAYININGKTAILPKGLSVFAQGSEQITDFGQYHFMSYQKIEDRANHAVTLSGYVAMNGWLNFNDDIILAGNLNDTSISLQDLSGATVCYDRNNSEGLAVILAKTGLPVVLPALGYITLYHDKDYEHDNGGSPRVEAFSLEDALGLGHYFDFSQINLSLYPNAAAFETGGFIAKLPFAGQILKNKADLFVFDNTAGITVSSKKIGCKLDMEYSPGETLENTFHSAGLGNMPIYISRNDMEIHIDTIANDYEFKFAMKTAFIAGENALGLSVKWDNPDSGAAKGAHDNGLVPAEIKVYADADVDSVIAGVPVTWGDFMFGVTGIDTSKSPVYWTLTGGFDLSACKISKYAALSGLEDWIGDVSIAKIDDAAVSFSLGDCYLKADGSFKLLGALDCGSLELELGRFTYSSALLDMDEGPVAGIRAKATIGPNWEFGKSKLMMQGHSEIDAINKFLGVQLGGDFEFIFKVWIISASSGKQSGNIAVGIRTTSDGGAAFVVRSRPKNANLTFPANAAGKLS